MDESAVREAVFVVRDRVRTFVEAAEAMDFFFREPPITDEAAKAKFLVPANAPNLRALAALFDGADPWEAHALEARLNAWLAEKGLLIKDVAQAARVAVTGRAASPGLFQVMQVLGKAVSLARLSRAATMAEAAGA